MSRALPLLRAWLLAFCAWGAVAHAQAPLPVPTLKSPVTDLSATLSPAEISALERKLLAFESQRGSQIAILIVPTTAPETIDEYSIRVVDQNKIGRKSVDDGVLILLAMQEAQLRIEVGRGLEGAIPDVAAGRIRRDIMNPQFRAGKFYGGLNAGVDTLMRLIEGEQLPPARNFDTEGQGTDGRLPIILVMAVVFSGFLRSIFGRFFGSALSSGLAGLIFWFIVGSIFSAALLMIAVFFFSLFAGAGGRRFGGGGFGGFGGGGFGGGGGGWSGGGGGFSGGGSSGSWR